MNALLPMVYFFAFLGFLIFAGVAGLMIAGMIANYKEDMRKRRSGK